MIALVTGASSGIGKDMAKILSNMGYDLILVARRKERLEELKSTLNTNIEIICADLSKKEECISLYEQVKDKDINILINNAGFGVYGPFHKTDLNSELKLIKTNICAVHILTKLFLKDFRNKNKGYILNVSSMAGIMPGGPLMATYYASKAYVLNLTRGIYQELKNENSNVYIGALCPGPVNTEFNKVSHAHFNVKSLSSMEVAKCGIRNMFQRKPVIVPGKNSKLIAKIVKFIPNNILLNATFKIQEKKQA